MSNPPSAAVYRAEPLPIKVGILMDMPERINRFAFPSYELVKEQYLASGRFERGIEFGPTLRKLGLKFD